MDIDLDGDVILDDRTQQEIDDDAEVDQFIAEVSGMSESPPVINAANDGDSSARIPAAYNEPLVPVAPRPEFVNLQWSGLDGQENFSRTDIINYALEHLKQKPKNLEWVNDWSINLKFENPQVAGNVVIFLTHTEEGYPYVIPSHESRRGKDFSERPDVQFAVRIANTGDVKVRNAANSSLYYSHHPQYRRRGVRDHPDLDTTSSPDTAAILDYGEDVEAKYRGRKRANQGIRSGSSPGRATIAREGNHQGRRWKDDSYRPGQGSYSRYESREGRLRGRSDSPTASEDGRHGFDEYGRNCREQARTDRQRSTSPRSRDRYYRDRDYRQPLSAQDDSRRKKDTSVYNADRGHGGGSSNAFPNKTGMSNHRRTDATDETNKIGIIDRSTEDEKPGVFQNPPLDSRASFRRKESSYGRLKNDDSIPQEDNFSSDDDFSIRGMATKFSDGKGGFSFRGAAGGN